MKLVKRVHQLLLVTFETRQVFRYTYMNPFLEVSSIFHVNEDSFLKKDYSHNETWEWWKTFIKEHPF